MLINLQKFHFMIRAEFRYFQLGILKGMKYSFLMKFIAVSRKIANHVMNLIFLWDWNGRSWMVYAINSMEMQRENNSYFLSYSDFMSQLNQVIKVEIYINYVRKLQKSERMWFEKYFLKIFIISRLGYQKKDFFSIHLPLKS